MVEPTAVMWLVAAVCALFVGMNKTGVPGIGILVVPLMAEYFGARASTGLVLPMLMVADVFAVAYYRRHAVWSHLLRIMPWTALGVVLGYFALERINDEQLKPIIGVIVLAMLAANFWRNSRLKDDASVPKSPLFAAGLGLAAGVTTMMANVAGPIMAVYLLAMRLPKSEFIGTGAWYYLILNWFKVPFSASIGLITLDSLQLDLMLFPVVAAGALGGILLFKRIPEREFAIIVQVLAAIASITLLF